MRLILTILILSPFLKSCGAELKGSEPADIACEFLNAWDFLRCENEEVICYQRGEGLSCGFKSLNLIQTIPDKKKGE